MDSFQRIVQHVIPHDFRVEGKTKPDMQVRAGNITRFITIFGENSAILFVQHALLADVFQPFPPLLSDVIESNVG